MRIPVSGRKNTVKAEYGRLTTLKLQRMKKMLKQEFNVDPVK